MQEPIIQLAMKTRLESIAHLSKKSRKTDDVARACHQHDLPPLRRKVQLSDLDLVDLDLADLDLVDLDLIDLDIVDLDLADRARSTSVKSRYTST